MSDYNSPMEARIQFGDDVIVIITDENEAWRAQEAVVINVPQGQGDLWQFQRPDGSVFAINTCHNSFVGMVKRVADG